MSVVREGVTGQPLGFSTFLRSVCYLSSVIACIDVSHGVERSVPISIG